MAGDVPHHALWEYHSPHLLFSTHTTYGLWRSTPCSITHCTPSIFHTQHMACDAPLHAAWEYHAPHLPFSTHTTCDIWRCIKCSINTEPLHLAYTAYGTWRSTPCSKRVSCTTPSIFHTNNICRRRSTPCSMTVSCTTASIFHTHNIWQVTLYTVLHNTLHPYVFHAHFIWQMMFTPCSTRVSCTTPSIFHTHNVWQVTLLTMLYHTLHNHHISYAEHMATDAPHHVLWEYYAPHPPLSAHTTNGRWRSTPCFMRVSCTTPSIFTYEWWRFVPCCIRVHCTIPSIFHPHTTYGRWRFTSCSITHCTRCIFHTHNIWQRMLHTMLYHTLHPSIYYTHSIWQVTLHTMLYKSIMHHTLQFLHTQQMAGDDIHHALLHAKTPLSSIHTAYGSWRFTPCSMRLWCTNGGKK